MAKADEKVTEPNTQKMDKSIKEKWHSAIWTIGTGLVILSCTSTTGYYVNRYYQFSSDKHAEFKVVRKEMSELRNNINILSAMVKKGPQGKSENTYDSQVRNLGNSIANQEVTILNDTGDWSYYFGDDGAKKEALFITWSNTVTEMILTKKYFPSDDVTDEFYYSLIFSFQSQIYSPYHCTQCSKLARITSKNLISHIAKFDPKYPKSNLLSVNLPLHAKDFYSLRILSNNFGLKTSHTT